MFRWTHARALAARVRGRRSEAVISIPALRRDGRRPMAGGVEVSPCEALESRLLFDATCPDRSDEVPPDFTSCETAPSNASEGPVRFIDGTPIVKSTDLSTDALGVPWGHTRSWSGLNNAAGANGNGWVVEELPYLVIQTEARWPRRRSPIMDRARSATSRSTRSAHRCSPSGG
jgi:hypothetical protein